MIERHSTWPTPHMVALVIAAFLCGSPTRAEDADEMLVLKTDALEFAPIPDMPFCATAATVRGNPVLGAFWAYLKLRSGCRVPRHWHSANETLIVISGRGSIAMKDGPTLPFVPGAYANLPSEHMHEAHCVRECLLFSISDGAYDIHYVDENGEELSPEDAMKRVMRPQAKKAKKSKK